MLDFQLVGIRLWVTWWNICWLVLTSIWLVAWSPRKAQSNPTAEHDLMHLTQNIRMTFLLTCDFGSHTWFVAHQRTSNPVRDFGAKRPSLWCCSSAVYLGHLPFDVLVPECALHSSRVGWLSHHSTSYPLGKLHEANSPGSKTYVLNLLCWSYSR